MVRLISSHTASQNGRKVLATDQAELTRLRRQDPFQTIRQTGKVGDSAVPDAEDQSQRIGSYRIIRPIASGTMGQVFQAANEATGETVALKLIRQADGERFSDKDLNFFLREAAMLSRLNHPRIVSIRDFGCVDGQLYMAMEYVETFDLRNQLMQLPTPQQIRLVCGIGCYMLAGLAHAHAQNIVHRDIKPANLLVYRTAGKANKIGIKLADFGISKDVRNAGLSGMTADGDMRGTLAFMSPEQLQNPRHAGPASDLYATAAVLYYFLTGTVPHQEAQDVAVKLCRIVEQEPLSIAGRRSDLPQRLCEVIDRGLAPLGSGRYETAIEFNQALLEFTQKGSRVAE